MWHTGARTGFVHHHADDAADLPADQGKSIAVGGIAWSRKFAEKFVKTGELIFPVADRDAGYTFAPFDHRSIALTVMMANYAPEA